MTRRLAFYVYPEAATALQIFELVQTQWRDGMNGITGRDYAAVIPVINLFTTHTDERILTLEMINALKTGCLIALAEYRKKQEKKRKA
jgi:hypothetical protein